jgi:hypothetical protein
MTMYRVIAILCGSLLLAACESNADWMKTPDWMKTSAFKWDAPLETIRFESEPPGAEAKASNGQSCRTPCALALPGKEGLTVNFTLNGYQPDTEKLELVGMGDGTSQLRPNPVLVALTPAPPPPKPKKKVVHRKKTAAKPVSKPAPKPARAAAPAPIAPPPQQSSSPWPSAPPPTR